MGDIGQLPPAYRVPPASPTPGGGKGSQAPQRKPATGDRHPDKRRQRKKDDDDAQHIDEYA